jgi:predicted HNH restriction endonuclease
MKNKFNKGFKTKYITIKRIKTKSNIETKCKGMKSKKKNLINDSRYTIIKKIRIKFDIKINCEGMKLKKKLTQQTNEGQIHYIQNNEDQIEPNRQISRPSCFFAMGSTIL